VTKWLRLAHLAIKTTTLRSAEQPFPMPEPYLTPGRGLRRHLPGTEARQLHLISRCANQRRDSIRQDDLIAANHPQFLH
jgi:hypothetical protein